jgi:hypothetical protein
MSAAEQLPDVPGMPVTLTPRAVRDLLPVKFGKSVRLDLIPAAGAFQLALSSSAQGKAAYLSATPAGWIEAWRTAAEWAPASGFRRAVQLYVHRASSSRVPLRPAEVAARLDEQLPLVLGGLTFLGGQGGGDLLQAGMMLDLRCRPSAIVLVDVSDGTVRCELAADNLTAAEASGAGEVGQGFVMALGRGLVGNLATRNLPSVIAAARQTEIRTDVRIASFTAELFFRSATDLPERAHSLLSRVRAMTGRLPE